MKFFWSRGPRQPSQAVLDERAKTAETQRELDETRARTPEMQALSDKLTGYRERNHFGDALWLAMMAKQQGGKQ